MKKINYFLLTKSIGFYINVLSLISPKKATQKAYDLFSIPRKGKITLNSIPEILQNAEAVTLDFEGNTIQTYIWKGDKTVIFLIHGWESNSGRWKKALPFLLESGNTIVAIDAPAHHKLREGGQGRYHSGQVPPLGGVRQGAHDRAPGVRGQSQPWVVHSRHVQSGIPARG